jgi:hypothetical protein
LTAFQPQAAGITGPFFPSYSPEPVNPWVYFSIRGFKHMFQKAYHKRVSRKTSMLARHLLYYDESGMRKVNFDSKKRKEEKNGTLKK